MSKHDYCSYVLESVVFCVPCLVIDHWWLMIRFLIYNMVYTLKPTTFMEIPISLANHVAQKDAAAKEYHVSKRLECTFLYIGLISKTENSSDTVGNLQQENE